MSDRIAVMNGGVVEHLGTPEEVYLSPASLFVAGFIGQTSFLPGRVESVGADGADVSIEGGHRSRSARVDPRVTVGSPGGGGGPARARSPLPDGAAGR